jgi:hypothetical protein
MTIAQDAKQLSVEYMPFSRYDMQAPVTLLYMLDGSESRNRVMLSHSARAQTSRAAWDGPALVITTQHTFTHPATAKPLPVEVKQRLVLESPTTLVIEVTRAGVLGGQATTTRTTYRKG